VQGGVAVLKCAADGGIIVIPYCAPHNTAATWLGNNAALLLQAIVQQHYSILDCHAVCPAA